MVLIIKGFTKATAKKTVAVQEIGDKRVVQETRFIQVDPGFQTVLKCQYNNDIYFKDYQALS